MILKQAIDFEKEPKPTKIGKNLQTGPTTPWSPPQELAYGAHESPCFLVLYIFYNTRKFISKQLSSSHFLALDYIVFLQQTIFSEFSFQLLFNHSILSHTPAGHTYKNKILNFDNIKHSLLLFPFPFVYYKKVKNCK